MSEDHRIEVVLANCDFGLLLKEMSKRPEWNNIDNLLEWCNIADIDNILHKHPDKGGFVFYSQVSDEVLVTQDLPNDTLEGIIKLLIRVLKFRQNDDEEE